MILMRKLAEHALQGRTEVQGIPVAIENRKGSVREGTTEDGHHWRTKMRAPYGFIEGTKGKDGEEIDAYVGPDKDAPKAYVVHQHKPDGTGFDEDKLILAVRSKTEAKKLYLDHYDDPKFLGPMETIPIRDLPGRLKACRGGKLTSKEASFQQGFPHGGSRDSKLPGYLVDRSTLPEHSEGHLPIKPELAGRVGGDSASVEHVENGSVTDPEVLRHRMNGRAPGSHGEGNLKVPLSRASVEAPMHRLRDQLQVVDRVVQPVSVPVMDNLRGEQRSPKVRLHDDSVFQLLPLPGVDQPVLRRATESSDVPVSSRSSHESEYNSSSKVAQAGSMTRKLAGGTLGGVIHFPDHEHYKLRKRLDAGKDIYTTRIQAEKGRYWEGQLLDSPFGKLRVVGVQTGRGRHPFEGELTSVEKTQLGEHPFDLIQLRKLAGQVLGKDKVILGVRTKEEAKKLYLQHYDDPKFLGPISTIPIEELKEKLDEKAGETIRKLAEQALADKYQQHGHERAPVGSVPWHFHNYEHGYKHCRGSRKNPYTITEHPEGHLIDVPEATGHGRHRKPTQFRFAKKLPGGYLLESGEKVAALRPEAGEFAPGIPAERGTHPIPKVHSEKPQTWQMATQLHEAHRAGKHIDLRLVDPQGRAHSWALPKAKMPSPGELVLAIRTPTHSAAYAARQGTFELGEGYGKGRVHGSGLQPVEVVRSQPGRVRFNVSSGVEAGQQEYLLLQTPRSWLLRNVSATAERGAPAMSDKLREEVAKNPGAYIGHAVKVRTSEGQEKRAEPPPPKGVPVKVWDKLLQRGPGKEKKAGQLEPPPSGLARSIVKGLPALATWKYMTGPYLEEGKRRHVMMMKAVREGWPASLAAE